MDYTTRPAAPDDADGITQLLPRLADFTLPRGRTSEMLWASDADLVREWSEGRAPDTFIRVGVDTTSRIVATAIVTMRPDPLSRDPSAHLEVIVVAPEADGHGLGRMLIGEAETEAANRGAATMSLNVLGNNTRARHVYQKLGYAEEMINCVRFL